jgi:hypothetical protein
VAPSLGVGSTTDPASVAYHATGAVRGKECGLSAVGAKLSDLSDSTVGYRGEKVGQAMCLDCRVSLQLA